MVSCASSHVCTVWDLHKGSSDATFPGGNCAAGAMLLMPSGQKGNRAIKVG